MKVFFIFIFTLAYRIDFSFMKVTKKSENKKNVQVEDSTTFSRTISGGGGALNSECQSTNYITNC